MSISIVEDLLKGANGGLEALKVSIFCWFDCISSIEIDLVKHKGSNLRATLLLKVAFQSSVN